MKLVDVNLSVLDRLRVAYGSRAIGSDNVLTVYC